MKKLLENKFLLFTIIGSVLVVAVVAFTLFSATATKKAVVFNSDVSAGTTITSGMLQEIDVPKDTPGDFYQSVNAVIGERTTGNISKGQLIYPNNLMSSIEVGADINENFITTSIRVSDDNAIGGLLTAGDVVDIAVKINSGDSASLAQALPEYSINTSVDGGFYYILSNVTLLDTTTAVSSAKGSELSAATSDGDSSSTSGEAYYMISISYNDYKKLRIAEQYGELYLNLVPEQNSEYNPLLEEMAASVSGGLTDASTDTLEKEHEQAHSKTKSSSKSNDSTKNNDEESSEDKSSGSSNESIDNNTSAEEATE